MENQHSICATYVLQDRIKPGDKPVVERRPVHPDLEIALAALDEKANRFFEEHPNYQSRDTTQSFSPSYKILFKSADGELSAPEVSDITRILIYTQK